MKNSIKVTFAAVGIAAAALAAAPSSLADDAPQFAAPGVTVTTGGANGGTTSPARVGDLGTFRPSLVADPGTHKLQCGKYSPNGSHFVCI